MPVGKAKPNVIPQGKINPTHSAAAFDCWRDCLEIRQ